MNREEGATQRQASRPANRLASPSGQPLSEQSDNREGTFLERIGGGHGWHQRATTYDREFGSQYTTTPPAKRKAKRRAQRKAAKGSR
jgi:hypothetical protein